MSPVHSWSITKFVGSTTGTNIMSDAADITRQTYSFIADQVARAVA